MVNFHAKIRQSLTKRITFDLTNDTAKNTTDWLKLCGVHFYKQCSKF